MTKQIASFPYYKLCIFKKHFRLCTACTDWQMHVSGFEKSRGFHARNSKDTLSSSNDSCIHWLIIQAGSYWCFKFPGLLFLWLVSEPCQTSTSTRVAFKWLHIPLTSRQPAVISSPYDWLMSLTMDLAALCDNIMWWWIWH